MIFGVSLLTLHAAKGLEFRVVFVTGCEDGVLPFKWQDAITEDELAEERRLFYVGMTRARERLFLSHARKRPWRGRLRQQQPSPFLTDIEEQLLEIKQLGECNPAISNRYFVRGISGRVLLFVKFSSKVHQPTENYLHDFGSVNGPQFQHRNRYTLPRVGYLRFQLFPVLVRMPKWLRQWLVLGRLLDHGVGVIGIPA